MLDFDYISHYWWPWPRSYLQGHNVHIGKIRFRAITSDCCWTWIIFHIIVVLDPRPYNLLGQCQNSNSQNWCPGHKFDKFLCDKVLARRNINSNVNFKIPISMPAHVTFQVAMNKRDALTSMPLYLKANRRENLSGRLATFVFRSALKLTW